MNKIPLFKLFLLSLLSINIYALAQIITVKSGFNNPKKVEVDASGNIFILDGNIIKKMDGNGNGLATIGTAGDPYDFALDSSGEIYIAEATPVVNKMAANGNTSNFFSLNAQDGAGGITIDTSDKVYVADTENNQIIKLNTSGTVLQNITDNLLDQPSAITTDVAGNIYAGIYGGNLTYSIVKIPVSGSPVSVIKSGIAGYPLSIAIDSAGNIYYIEYASTTIKRMNSSGANLVSIGSGFNFTNGGGLAIDSTGNLYIADYGNGAIKKIAATSLGVSKPISSSTVSLSPNPAKDYTVINHLNKGDKIALYDTTGKLLYQTTATDSTLTFNTSAYANGVYLLSVGEQNLKLLISK